MKRFAILLALLLLPSIASAQWRFVDGTLRPVYNGNPVTLGSHSTGDALRILEPSASGSNYIAFKAPAMAANAEYTLPNGLPSVSGQVLSSTDAGVMSWATISGGITIDTTAITGGAANRILFESSTNKVSESANFTFGTTSTGLKVTAGSATTIGAIIQGAAAQTANLQEWQNSAGTVFSSVTSAGKFLAPDGINTAPAYSFSNVPTVGFFVIGSQVHFSDGGGGGANSLGFVGGLRFANSGGIRWSSTTSSGDTPDAAVVRHAAGIIALTTGGQSTDGAPAATTLIGQSSLGTDIAGAALNIASGKGTGAGAPGVLNLQTAPSGASGSALNALVTAASFDASTTAGNTRMLLTDHLGVSRRVKVSADLDTAGNPFLTLAP